MGKAIEKKMGIDPNEKKKHTSKRLQNGNRRERKLKTEIKQLRQLIARTSNEIYWRKQQRTYTPKEKKILTQLKKKINETELTTSVLMKHKEVWIGKLRYRRAKLVKMIERGKRIMDNNIFERDHLNFFERIEYSTDYEAAMPEMDKFVKFWVGIWEKDDCTPNMPWMEKIREELKEKISSVKEFEITKNGLISEIKKKKNWTAPGVDGIQNFWWKTFRPAQKALKKVFEQIRDNNRLIPTWWPLGRRVLITKSKDLSDEKNYRPITCLNTLYKHLTTLVGMFMKNHATENKIWDEGQLGRAEGVLGIVYQLIIDRCIMEEVKTQHRNLAVAFYDYKKAYDKVHHDWMLRVYSWMGLPVNVISLLRQLMRYWKTRLEIWNEGKRK